MYFKQQRPSPFKKKVANLLLQVKFVSKLFDTRNCLDLRKQNDHMVIETSHMKNSHEFFSGSKMVALRLALLKVRDADGDKRHLTAGQKASKDEGRRKLLRIKDSKRTISEEKPTWIASIFNLLTNYLYLGPWVLYIGSFYL